MKKILAITVAALLAGFGSLSAQAGVTNSPFNVVINFTPVCTVGGALAPTFTYTSNQGAAAAAGGTLAFSVTCTTGVPYTLTLDTSGEAGFTYTGGVAPAYNYTDTASTLNYTLTLPAAAAGTGAAQPYTLSGNMPGAQAGKCTVFGGCTFTDVHTMIVTF